MTGAFLPVSAGVRDDHAVPGLRCLQDAFGWDRSDNAIAQCPRHATSAGRPNRPSGPWVSVPSRISVAKTRSHISAGIPKRRCACPHVRRRHGISLNSARTLCSNCAREALFRRSGRSRACVVPSIGRPFEKRNSSRAAQQMGHSKDCRTGAFTRGSAGRSRSIPRSQRNSPQSVRATVCGNHRPARSVAWRTYCELHRQGAA